MPPVRVLQIIAGNSAPALLDTVGTRLREARWALPSLRDRHRCVPAHWYAIRRFAGIACGTLAHLRLRHGLRGGGVGEHREGRDGDGDAGDGRVVSPASK